MVLKMDENDALKIIPDFHHQPGVHCTSSALRNVFAFHGANMTEAMVFGLGLGMSLGYLKIPGMEPFFGGRNKDFVKDFCDILNISLNEFTTKDPETGWIRLKERTESNIPSVINIDMAYLPYQDLADDFHFGGHTIAVCGHNSERNSVSVTDTHFSEILEVPVNDLTKGRSSKKDRFMAPNNVIFEFTFKDDIPPIGSIIENVINRTGTNLISKSNRVLKLMGIHGGTEGIAVFSKHLDKWMKLSEDKFKARCIQQAGYIGTKEFNYGTGGGLFRFLFSEFLDESANQIQSETLKELSEYYSSLGKEWESVASLFEEVSKVPTREKRKSIVNKIKTKLSEIKTLEEKGANKLIDFKLK
jgi:hypothetical protein